jgi:hypothetical protein
MYHMVRFFDRKKIVRRLQRAEKVCFLRMHSTLNEHIAP